MSQNQSFGMMDPGYFKSRGEIICWINELLKVKFVIRQTFLKFRHQGQEMYIVIYLMLFILGKCLQAKLIGRPNLTMNLLTTLKFYRIALINLGLSIIKKFQFFKKIEKLSKAKYQDNLELAQWFKRFFDLNNNGNKYQAQQRRGNSQLDFSFCEKCVKVNNNKSVNQEKSKSVYIRKQNEKYQSSQKKSDKSIIIQRKIIDKIRQVIKGEKSCEQKIQMISSILNQM